MHGVDNRQVEIVAAARGRKATRIIKHLDAHLGQPIVSADVSGWDLAQWHRMFDRAGETWNAEAPLLTIDAVLNRVAVRDRVRHARLVNASR